MRKTLMALAVLSLMTLPALAQAAPGAGEALIQAPTADPAPAAPLQVAPEVTTDATPALTPVESGFEAVPQTLPSCWNFDGNSCSTPGTHVHCQWIPLEPGICVCRQNYVWLCG